MSISYSSVGQLKVQHVPARPGEDLIGSLLKRFDQCQLDVKSGPPSLHPNLLAIGYDGAVVEIDLELFVFERGRNLNRLTIMDILRSKGLRPVTGYELVLLGPKPLRELISKTSGSVDQVFILGLNEVWSEDGSLWCPCTVVGKILTLKPFYAGLVNNYCLPIAGKQHLVAATNI